MKRDPMKKIKSEKKGKGKAAIPHLLDYHEGSTPLTPEQIN